jgi:hypothetical protein
MPLPSFASRPFHRSSHEGKLEAHPAKMDIGDRQLPVELQYRVIPLWSAKIGSKATQQFVRVHIHSEVHPRQVLRSFVPVNDFWEVRSAVDRQIAEKPVADFSCFGPTLFPSKGIRHFDRQRIERFFCGPYGCELSFHTCEVLRP